MEQHALPRQITTFEFKLVGFMTVKQFVYIIVFVPLGFLVFRLFPIPLVNILLGIITASAGFALAFVPINDRPLDVWIKNFLRRITSPTQYLYHKENKPLYFFEDLYFESDPHRVFAHVESQEKLNQYLATKKVAEENAAGARRQAINQALRNPSPLPAAQSTQSTQQTKVTVSTPASVAVAAAKKPFIVGVIRNNRKIPLPGILIYIKDQKGTSIRLLKSNPHGIFASYSTLPAGEYMFELKDPQGNFIFDTMKINIDQENHSQLEFYSKELL